MLGLLTRHTVLPTAVEPGTTSLRAVQLRREGSRYRVHHWLNIEHEPESATPAEANHAEQVKLAFGPGAFTGDKASLLIGPPDVEFRMIDVPGAVLKDDKLDLRSALQFELDRQMPWPTLECEVAVWPAQNEAAKKVNTLVAAARSLNVQRYIDMLDDSSVACGRADVIPSAMIELRRSVTASDEQKAATELWGVLDIGFLTSRLYMMHRDTPVYARVVRGSGRELTQALCETLNVEFRIAEQYKRVYGIEQTDRAHRSMIDGLSRMEESALPGVLYSILRTLLDTMCDELERSFRFALGRLRGASATTLYLVGGGAKLKGLTQVLSNRLGIDVVLPSADMVFDRMTADSQSHPLFSETNFPVLAPCLGMAMSEGNA